MTNATASGFTVTYSGPSAGVDVPSIQLVELDCGCFSSVEETNHGGAFDSFRLNYNGLRLRPRSRTAPTTRPWTLTPRWRRYFRGRHDVTVSGFGGGTFNNTGFQVTYGGTLALTNVPVLLAVQDFTAGASGFANETDKGGL